MPAALTFPLQDVALATLHKCLFPTELDFQSPLMSIYGTALRQNLIYSNPLNSYERGLREKTC